MKQQVPVPKAGYRLLQRLKDGVEVTSDLKRVRVVTSIQIIETNLAGLIQSMCCYLL